MHRATSPSRKPWPIRTVPGAGGCCATSSRTRAAVSAADPAPLTSSRRDTWLHWPKWTCESHSPGPTQRPSRSTVVVGRFRHAGLRPVLDQLTTAVVDEQVDDGAVVETTVPQQRAHSGGVEPLHLVREAGMRVGPVPVQRVDDRGTHLGRLVLAELETRIDPVDPDAQPDGALGDPTRFLLVVVEGDRVRHRRLEMVDQSLQDREVLLVRQDLGRAVQVRGHVVPGRHEVAVGVPARRDVAVRALHDDEHLVLPELVQLLVGAAEVAHDGDALCVLLEQRRVVRGDQAVRGVRDEGHPGVLADQPLDLLHVGGRVGRCLPHPRLLCLIHRAPVQLATAQLLHHDRGPADAARLAGAVIHPVPIGA